MSEQRRLLYTQSATRLIHHLDYMLHPITGYPDEPSWGYAFTYLVALQANNGFISDFSNKAVKLVEGQNMNNPNFSWEFVIFALQKSKQLMAEPAALPVEGYREKGTRMFNWFLLRMTNKKMLGKFTLIDEIKLRAASKLYQDRSGLILDEFRTRSLQYHAFCLFLLSELLQTNPDNVWIRNWFLRGIDFAIEKILPDGTALYIGRGQEQIFGYGALIYALEYCHQNVKPLDESILDRLSNKVLSFQREDGSYPLVLRHRQPEPAGVNFKNDQPAGWYSYNTLYDYQPFLAYCLMKAGALS